MSTASLTPLQAQRLEAVADALAAVRVELHDHITQGGRLALVDARDRLADLARLVDTLDRRPFELRLG